MAALPTGIPTGGIAAAIHYVLPDLPHPAGQTAPNCAAAMAKLGALPRVVTTTTVTRTSFNDIVPWRRARASTSAAPAVFLFVNYYWHQGFSPINTTQKGDYWCR